MRKLIILIIAVSLSSAIYAQSPEENFRSSIGKLFDETWRDFAPDSIAENGCWSKVIEMQMSAKDAYKSARSVLAKAIPNYQNRVKMEDEQSHKIICDISLELTSMERYKGENHLLSGVYKFTLTLVFKDKKYLAKAENVRCDYRTRYLGSTLDVERDKDYSHVYNISKGMVSDDFKRESGAFLRDFTSALKSAQDEDNF